VAEDCAAPVAEFDKGCWAESFAIESKAEPSNACKQIDVVIR
jgi:hypothetical protein